MVVDSYQQARRATRDSTNHMGPEVSPNTLTIGGQKLKDRSRWS